MAQQISQADVDSALAAARAAIRENWGWFLGLGIVFVLAGFGAIAFPFLTTVARQSRAGLDLHDWRRGDGRACLLIYGLARLSAQLPDRRSLPGGRCLARVPAIHRDYHLTILLAALFLAEACSK